MVKHLLRGPDLTSQGPTNPFIRLGLDKCSPSCIQGIKVLGKHFTCCCTSKCWHLVRHYFGKIWILPKNKLVATKPLPHLKTVLAILADANSTWRLVPGHWSCNLLSIISMTAWFCSHRPFWNRLSTAVVHTLMFRMLATSLISSELNSPPLSVNSISITPKPASTQQVITLSMTSEGRFRDRNKTQRNEKTWCQSCAKSIDFLTSSGPYTPFHWISMP